MSAQGVMKHLQKFQKIADENGDTRASGTPGFDESADYVAKKMENAGYKVERQPFEFEFLTEETEPMFEQTAPDPAITRTARTSSRWSSPARAMRPRHWRRLTSSCPPGASRAPRTRGCETADFTGFTAGNIALVQRGTCDFAVKADNAIAAGAVGVVIFNEGQEGRTDVLNGTLAAPRRAAPVIGATFALGEELANGETNGPTGITVHLVTDTSRKSSRRRT